MSEPPRQKIPPVIYATATSQAAREHRRTPETILRVSSRDQSPTGIARPISKHHCAAEIGKFTFGLTSAILRDAEESRARGSARSLAIEQTRFDTLSPVVVLFQCQIRILFLLTEQARDLDGYFTERKQDRIIGGRRRRRADQSPDVKIAFRARARVSDGSRHCTFSNALYPPSSALEGK